MAQPSSLQANPQPTSYASRPRLLVCAPPRRLGLQACAASRPHRSFDSEDELDARTSEEFKRVANPQQYEQLAKHLELLWSVSERKRPEQCESCSGSGEKECTWCHGTGVMTVGDTLFCGPEGCKACPVCRGMGQCKCENCRGTGQRAGWMDRGHRAPS